ncbi:MAG: hypothetical protein HY928_13715 [Elusimicrobia bacterium]|nr:hypothetical protein [Elusimicrobiota bacterium]
MRRTAFLFLACLAAGAPAAGQAVCPAGTRLHGGACVKDRAAAWAAPSAPPPAAEALPKEPGLSCAAFNARLAAFHAARSGDYAADVRRHRQVEQSLRDEADDDRRLAADLTRQARRARDRSTRAMLLRQARAAGQAAEDAEARIAAAELDRTQAETALKARYKAEALQVLALRPAGCAVKGPGK